MVIDRAAHTVHRLPPLMTYAISQALLAVTVAVMPASLWAQEGVFLTEEQAPRAVFADADGFARQVVTASPDMRDRMRKILGTTEPSVWEDQYVVFTATHGDTIMGHAIIVEEIGKHRPITFVVGIRSDGSVSDVAVMTYREAYGGEVRSKRFLTQYRGKNAQASLHTYGDIQNVAGATLSVDAANRAVKKALAVDQVALGTGAAS